MSIYIKIISDLAEKNKYFFWWKSIIESRLTRSVTRNEAKKLFDYIEGHHIVPVSFELGGEKDPNNIVFLTSKEHILIHHLMCKFLEGIYRTRSLRAFHCMCVKDNGGKNQRNPSLYQKAEARKAAAIANQGKKGIKGTPTWFTESDDFEYFKLTLTELVSSGLSDPEISKKYGVSATAIFNWRIKLDIGKRRWQLRNKDWLYDHYVNQKLSAQKIGDLIGSTGEAVQLYLKKFNIPIRGSSDRQKLRYR
jgi:transposase-like protein